MAATPPANMDHPSPARKPPVTGYGMKRNRLASRNLAISSRQAAVAAEEIPMIATMVGKTASGEPAKRGATATPMVKSTANAPLVGEVVEPR